MPQLRPACLVMCVLFACGAVIADAAQAADLPLLARGEAVYVDLCAGCHGEDALGGNGPDITRTPRIFVAEAVRGVDQMPEVELTEGEIDAVAAYLATLR